MELKKSKYILRRLRFMIILYMSQASCVSGEFILIRVKLENLCSCRILHNLQFYSVCMFTIRQFSFKFFLITIITKFKQNSCFPLTFAEYFFFITFFFTRNSFFFRFVSCVWFTIHHYLVVVVDLALPLFFFRIYCRRASLRWFHLFVDWGDGTPPDVNIASRWVVLCFYVIAEETRFHTKRDPWGLALMVLLSTMMLLLRHAGIGRWTLAFDPMLDWCWCIGCGKSWCWGS